MPRHPSHAATQLEDVHVRYHALPPETGGGVAVNLPDGSRWIVIDDRCPPAEQRVVLHHELEHLRRGSVRRPGVPTAVVEREEAAIRRLVTERLVPPADLADLVARAAAADEGLTTLDVADHFDVSVPIAREACRLLAQQVASRRR